MHLTVIAKTPAAGRVKTRLSPPCTPEQACEVAAAALADTIDAVNRAHRFLARRRVDVRRVLLLDGDPDDWLPPGYAHVPQRGVGLARRLANGYADLGPGVVIGMDTPAGGAWLGEAVLAVRAGTDVIGMASDGGYWLVGLAEPDPAVFDRIPMSTSNTGLAQIRRLHARGRPVRLLPSVRDLDDVADLRAVAASDAEGRLPSVARAVLAAGELDRAR